MTTATIALVFGPELIRPREVHPPPPPRSSSSWLNDLDQTRVYDLCGAFLICADDAGEPPDVLQDPEGPPDPDGELRHRLL